MPIHSIYSGLLSEVYLKQEKSTLKSVSSSLTTTTLGTSLTLSSPGEAVTLTTGLDTRWLDTRHMFSSPGGGQPGLAAWSPHSQYAGHLLR